MRSPTSPHFRRIVGVLALSLLTVAAMPVTAEMTVTGQAELAEDEQHLVVDKRNDADGDGTFREEEQVRGRA